MTLKFIAKLTPMVSILMLCIFFIAAPKSWAEESTYYWSCKKPVWIADPAVKGGQFVGSLKSKCLIQNTQKNGFSSLDARLLERATKNNTIHEGPKTETYYNMSSVRYDITYKPQSGMAIRHWVHVATDLKNRLIYSSLSSNITASGDAGYLKRVDFFLDVTPTEKPNEYSATMFTTAWIEEPWYVGVDFTGSARKTFIERASNETFSRFRSMRNNLIDDVAANL